jgi:hypothetical protein
LKQSFEHRCSLNRETKVEQNNVFEKPGVPARRNGQHRILLNKRESRFIPKISEAAKLQSDGRPLFCYLISSVTRRGKADSTLATMIRLDNTFPDRARLLDLTFGVVVFSILVQGLTIKPLLRILRLASVS